MNDPIEPQLSVGFILLPSFTLSAFAAFIDTLRLAADEGDQSRPIHCRWTVLSHSMDNLVSSCGVEIKPWETLRQPIDFDYLVLVGGLLHQGSVLNSQVEKYVQKAAEQGVTLIGLCTGSIALIRAGLMENRRCCVSWFHYRDLLAENSNVHPVADQLYVDDGDRITCSGGTVSADLAAMLVERHIGYSWAVKSLRIMQMDHPRPASAPQPQPPAQLAVQNKWVKKALLLIEQHMARPLSSEEIAAKLNLSKRHLERLLVEETGKSLQKLYREIRLNYGLWLLNNSCRTITKIAHECGFTDSAHFSRAFLAEFGQRPSQVRKNDSHGRSNEG